MTRDADVDQRVRRIRTRRFVPPSSDIGLEVRILAPELTPELACTTLVNFFGVQIKAYV
ncbi:MAG: hypothetical protein JSU73_11895 [candidate division WOR-3 bacterium]|nr:MAG: hypothetical protein JSU73_11895 [candidate division WOR-3 bacterium]